MKPVTQAELETGRSASYAVFTPFGISDATSFVRSLIIEVEALRARVAEREGTS